MAVPLLGALLVLISALLLADCSVCPKCGDTEVPYPLSTGAGCGHPSYNVTCDVERGVLVFPAKSGNHDILQTDGVTKTLIMATTAGILENSSCITTELHLLIDQSSPFYLTNANTILLFNCSQSLLLNCSAPSPCHRYLDQVSGVPTNCAPPGNFCCSSTANRKGIDINSHVCSAYLGVVKINDSLSPDFWTYGLQLSWLPAPLPPCSSTSNQCGEYAHCDQKNSGVPLCQCHPGYIWKSDNGTCIAGTCDQCEDNCKQPSKAQNGSIPELCQCNPGFTWDSYEGVCAAAPCDHAGCTKMDDTRLIAGVSVGFGMLMAAAIIVAVLVRKLCSRTDQFLRIREEKDEMSPNRTKA